jgi:hypothetical protein
MSLTCPNCKTDLPENDELEYRFCPRCGAEIPAPDGEIADNFQTIPPDLHHPVTQRQKHSPEPESMQTRPTPPPNQTIEPEIPQNSTPRPQLVPPPGPPPTSFFRTDSPRPPSVSDTPRQAQIQRPRNLTKIFIIIGTVVIFMGVIIFLFLA